MSKNWPEILQTNLQWIANCPGPEILDSAFNAIKVGMNDAPPGAKWTVQNAYANRKAELERAA